MPHNFANSPMANLPPTRRPTRAPRISLRGTVSATIQLENRRQFAAKLHQLSVTGGLLEVTNYIDERSRVALAFQIASGPLLTKAEMLFPMRFGNGYRQPFRFTGFGAGVRRTLEMEIATFLRETIVPQRSTQPATSAKPGRGSGLPLPRFLLDSF
jgi:hypothetical protein